nr:PREDICTED: pyroglutamyl-peptidase 1 isoform X3 [Macaca fascicularis]
MGAVAAAAGAAPGLRGRAGQVLEVLPDLEGVIARGSPAQPRLPGKWKRRSLGGPRVGSQGSQARGLGGRANARRRAGLPGVLSSQGFGPFGEHTVNASWIAVQELEKLGLGDSVDLHVYEIPVEYKTVQRLIPALWEKHSPQISLRLYVLHLSVPESRSISLRPRAPSGEAIQRRPAGQGTESHH